MRGLRGAAAVLGLFFGGTCPAPADVPADSLKAAVLYNFALFVYWPKPPTREFDLCLYGTGPFKAADAVEGRKVGRAKLRVRRPARAEELRSCRMVYLGGADPAVIEQALAAIADAPVLTVADASAFNSNPAMIDLAIENGRIVFDIDAGAAARVGIKFSARLLRLARRVY